MKRPTTDTPQAERWNSLTRWISTYEQRWSIVRWLSPPEQYDAFVDVWVLARIASLYFGVWGAYPFSTSSVIVIVFAVLTFGDYLIVVTANAFKPINKLHDRFRYVVLNLIGFVTLVPWFAIFLAPRAGDFVPALTERAALRTAWAAVTASAVIPSDPHGGLGAALVLAAATMTSLYLLVVILVIAVSRAAPTATVDR